MKIISHRGYWQKNEEKNTAAAFSRSFDLGIGTETDVRDYLGQLVISHDVADESCMTFVNYLKLLNGKDLPLAINIKSDGLMSRLVKELQQYELTDVFVFDMSVPDQLTYFNQNKFKVFTRMSEEERIPSFFSQSDGIWLDSFKSVWYGKKEIEKILNAEKELCIVSPELHQQAHLPLWTMLKKIENISSRKITLCTDYPTQAIDFFKDFLHD